MNKFVIPVALIALGVFTSAAIGQILSYPIGGGPRSTVLQGFSNQVLAKVYADAETSCQYIMVGETLSPRYDSNGIMGCHKQ